MKNRLLGILSCLIILPIAFWLIYLTMGLMTETVDPFAGILIIPGLFLLILAIPNIIAIFIRAKNKTAKYKNWLFFIQIFTLLIIFYITISFIFA